VILSCRIPYTLFSGREQDDHDDDDNDKSLFINAFWDIILSSARTIQK